LHVSGKVELVIFPFKKGEKYGPTSAYSVQGGFNSLPLIQLLLLLIRRCMIKKIDWYILRRFLTTFFFCLVLLTLIVVIVDISEKTDDFAKTGLPVSRIITDYYFGFIPKMDAMLAPLFVFISVIFFTSQMANRSEVIAILSSGVSYARFLRPYMIGGILLAGLLLWGNRQLLPRANQKWAAFDAKYIKFNYEAYRNSSALSNYYFRLDSFSYAGIRYYDTVRRTGNNFFIQTFKNNKLVFNMRAETITWDTITNKWKLERVLERRFNELNEDISQKDTLRVAYNFKPRDLQRDEYMKDKLTTPDLNEFINLEKIRGSEDVNTLLIEQYTRVTIPVSIIILTMIGAVLASRRIRGGSGFHLAMGVVITVLYILVSRFATVFSVKGNFNPWLAAWLPNFVFGMLAVYLYKKAPK
jgi:lipopolysaccharide export system permease protein